MLLMQCGKTLKDKISNDKIRKITRLESIDEFPQKNRDCNGWILWIEWTKKGIQ